MIIRKYRPGDAEALWRIYYDTTHLINQRDYTHEQCERWAPGDKDMGEWSERLNRTIPLVAEHGDDLVGFAELRDTGEIDFFYCHHEWQRRGIGSRLMEAIEAEAQKLGVRELRAHVSLTAKAFFLQVGFVVLKEQNNIVCGTPAPNFIMCKQLEPQK